MNVSGINCQNTNFKGNLYTKGVYWTPELKNAFLQSETFKQLANGEKML